MLLPDQQLGQYTVLSKIGEGGMGAVYLAEQPSIHRRVVVKVLSTGLAGDPDMLQRFRREVDIIARLEHPHIVPVYDSGEVEGDPYVVMRYMAGGSLLDRLRKQSIARPELLLVLEQVAEALDYAHDRDVIHRDLKPANVLLDERGNAYLADFGLAKTLEGALDLTKTGSVLGTPAYMSPEQARGDRLDARSDVYSFAVMAYQALSGEHPFAATTPMEYIQAHLSEPPRSIQAVIPDLPRSVDGVLGLALAKEKEKRPARTGEFMKNLRSALAEGMQIVGSVYDTVPAAAGGTGVALPTRQAAPRARQRGRSWAVPLAGVTLLGGGAIVLGLAGLGIFLFRDRLFGPAVATYTVGNSPRGMAFDGLGLWVANVFDGNLTRLSAAGCTSASTSCGDVLGTYALGDLPYGPVVAGNAVWAVSGVQGELYRIDPQTGGVSDPIPLPRLPFRLFAAGNELWTLNAGAGSVTRIRITDLVPMEFPLEFKPAAIASDGASIWLAGETDLVRLDPSSGTVLAHLTGPASVGALAFEGSRLWAVTPSDGSVVRINTTDGSIEATISIRGVPSDLLFDGSWLWIADPEGNRVVAVDPVTGREARAAIAVEGSPYSLAWVVCGSDCGDLWTANQSAGTVSRIHLEGSR